MGRCIGRCNLSIKALFTNMEKLNTEGPTAEKWTAFLQKNQFDYSSIEKIELSGRCPVIFDKAGNKFSIDFVNNKKNYAKKKSSMKSELISKAMGAGKYGLNILDLSAGLGIDAVFLAQMGYAVTALERNPLIYLALNEALQQKPELSLNLNLKFLFGEALEYLKNQQIKADVIYFDPMFPEKVKSALPRQEMVFFRKLLGHDEDAVKVLAAALCIKGVKRVVVKRPIKAAVLKKPLAAIEGKLIRFDFYKGAGA